MNGMTISKLILEITMLVLESDAEKISNGNHACLIIPEFVTNVDTVEFKIRAKRLQPITPNRMSIG